MALLLVAFATLAGCAASSYAGISFASGAADAELQDLARRARAGDPRAQLDLGIRYEEGIGLPVNRARARKLYLAAASGSGGSRIMQVPARGSSRGAAVPVSLGTAREGLREAQDRLLALNRGSRREAARQWVDSVIDRVEQIAPEPHCTHDPPQSRCVVYRLILSDVSTRLNCPVIAIDYRDDNGHRYVRWPTGVEHARACRWRLHLERETSPHCFYALYDASSEGEP